ncbi:acyltransferase [Mycobacterium celatum]|uniref:Acyltransferase n=1 Tax=Mycobacterium celatum TaxID=28045 RepID=A0A2G5PQT9_MYCCE|nr:acyltransferase [Mycobacterium celatum]
MGQVFDPRCNALNAWRLTLATGVILVHAYLCITHHVPSGQVLGDIWVDGFFAISGFLITGSWLNKRQSRVYFAARGLRIFPGLWVCLIVIAFILAPATGTVKLSSQIAFVLKNGTLLPLQPDIDGTPLQTHYHIWDGSLWTLLFEALFYVLIAVVGSMGLLKRWFISAAFVAAVTWMALLVAFLPPASFFREMLESGQPVGPDVFLMLVQGITARLLIMFLAGAVLYLYRDKIPANWTLVAVSAILAAVSMLLPDYRLVGAIPLAYMIIVSGALIRHKRLQLHNDLSYGTYIYSFPLQQLLLIVGLSASPLLFAAISTAVTLPVAALSWFLVERPSMRLKNRIKQRANGGVPAHQHQMAQLDPEPTA